MNDTIYSPRFKMTSVITACIDSAERSSWLIDNMLIMPKQESWIRREVSVRRAAATTRIEGASMDADEVSELAKRPPKGRVSEDEQANLNALEAYRFVDYLSDQPDIPLDELVIRELNRYFLKDIDETLAPGVYGNGQNKVGGVYMPPDQGDVAPLMRGYAHWLSTNGSDELHPFVKAGLAHIHLVAIHPFWDGNGRTARALATLILQRSRFHFRKLLNLEQFLYGIRRDYVPAIEQTLGDHFEPSYDATPWLQFFSNAVFAEAVRLTDDLTKWHQQIQELYRTLEPLNINHRQTEGIAYASRVGRMTRADYMEITNASPLTASRDLAKLVDLGVLVPKGKTRGRVYLFNVTGPRPNGEVKAEQRRLFDEAEEGDT